MRDICWRTWWAYMLVFSLLFCMAEDKGKIELKEVPSLGYSYSAMPGGSTYVLENDFYHMENGSYVKTDGKR